MNDEIKEMTNKIKKCLIAGYDLDIITQEEMNILWNYITTLQKDLKVACEVIEKLKNDKKKAIEYLKLFDRDSDMINHSIIRGALNILQGDDNNE